jgi:beta-glucosidase
MVKGGGSSETEPFKGISVLDAIKETAGDRINVDYLPMWIGSNLSAESSYINRGCFEPDLKDGHRKALAEYFSNAELTGQPLVTKTDDFINFKWNDGHPIEGIKTPSYSVRWTAKISAPQTDDYLFYCQSDGAKVILDGKEIIDSWTAPAETISTHKIKLEKGQSHDLVVEYHHRTGPSTMRFSWGKADPQFTSDEKNLITRADAVIASVGLNKAIECEGYDHAYDLPSEQVQLINNVAKLNSRVIAVLNAGGNVGMKDWVDDTAALLHAWYPGQNGNKAVAGVLFGDINPSGKLPDTFEAKWEDSPAFGNYPGDSANGGRVTYAEGIYVGYRSFDKRKLAPRYPFGYGLSYSTFSLDRMAIKGTMKSPEVLVDVKNTSKIKGATVVQLYVRPIGLKTAQDRPFQELKGFKRVELEPGESRSINFVLNKDSFATYDESAHKWTSPDGEYEIALGFSSRDIAAQKSLHWRSLF